MFLTYFMGVIMNIKDQLKSLSDDRLLEVYRKYCDYNDSVDRIYEMSEFDDVLDNRCPSNIAAMVLCATRFDFDDEYFTFTLSGLESYAYLHDLIDFDKLSQFIEKNQEKFQDFLFRDCVKKDIIGRLDGLSYEQICKVNDFIDDIV